MTSTIQLGSGYNIFPSILEPSECDEILGALAGAQRSKAGARHLLANPVVAALADDPRLVRLASEFLSKVAVPFRATYFDKSADSNWLVPWHQDTALPLKNKFDAEGWGPWSVKKGVHYAHAPTWPLSRVIALRVHLDDSRSDNGPLTVIPGSHELGVLTDAEVSETAHRSKPAECVVARGGVIAMRPLLIHSSPKSISADPRRVLHIEYADALRLAEGIELAIA